MKVVMSVDSMVTIELPPDLEQIFSEPNFDINKLDPKHWETLNELSAMAFTNKLHAFEGLDYHFEEVLQDSDEME